MTKTRVFVVLITSVVALIVFGITPFIKWQAEVQLSKLLKLDVTIHSITLAPFSGEYQVSGFEIANSLSLSGAVVHIELLPLLERHIHIRSISLAGIESKITQTKDNINIGQYQLPASSQEENSADQSPWTFQIDKFDLSNTELELNIELNNHVHVHKLTINSLALGPVTSDLEGVIDLFADLQLNKTSVKLQGAYQLMPTAEHKLEGELDLTEFDLKLIEPFLEQAIEGTVFTQQSFNFVGDASRFTVKSKGVTELSNLSFNEMGLSRLTLNQALETSKTVDNLNITSQGSVRLEQLTLNQQSVGELGWQGNVSFQQPLPPAPEAPQIEVKADGILSISSITDTTFGTVDRVELTSLSFDSGKSMTAESLIVTGMAANLSRNENGTFEGFSSDTNPDPTEKASPDLVPLDGINIKHFEINQSQINWSDQSVSPAVMLALNEINVVASPLTKKQDLDYKFSAKHQAGEARAATMKSEGVINLAEPLMGNAKLVLQNFELHEIGAYMGNSVQSGRLTLTSDLGLQSGLVHLKNHIEIQGMKLAKTKSDKPQDDASIALALYLLKDKKGDIELDVPIETDSENFSIGTQDIIARALRGGAQKAALNYAKFALQPYGSLLLLKDIAGAISKPRFEPIGFKPRSIEMSDDATGYTNKITEMLANKPEMRITVCGVATLLDMPEPTPEATTPEAPTPNDSYFLDLATRRGNAIRDSIEAGGIAATRIFSCKPIIEKTETEARVELTL